MAKAKRLYGCTECGATFPKWAGQCGECGAWNTLVESMIESGGAAAPSGRAGWTGQQAQLKTLAEVSVEEIPRFSTSSGELDRVLGGGLVDGSVVLIGGDPGIGKSTILLQTLCHMAAAMPALYVTGEESQQQVAMRSRRLGLPQDKLKVMTETCIETIIATARVEQPRVMVIDSIQTIFTEQLQSAPGGVAQVRESTALLVRYAKQSGTAIFLVGHVTKEGSLAGPRVLEHMVDTVLYFEGESDGRLRLLRAVKNRFGAVNELGVFGMTDRGLKEVSNPSAIFLNRTQEEVPAVWSWRPGKAPGRCWSRCRRWSTTATWPTRAGSPWAWTRTAWPCSWPSCTGTAASRPTIRTCSSTWSAGSRCWKRPLTWRCWPQ